MKIRLINKLLWLSCFISIWINTSGQSEPSATTERQVIHSPVDTIGLSINLEDEDGIYLYPQTVKFSVLVNALSDHPNLLLICKITTDSYLPVDSLVFNINPNTLQNITFTPPAPGFYRLSLHAEHEGAKSKVQKINIGYNPEQIVSPSDAKADFSEFWKKTRSELDQVPPRYKMTLLKEKSSDNKDIYHVEMYSFGNVKIEGYYTAPKKKGKHPAIIKFMGYAAKPRFPDINEMPDFCEFILSVRGQGIQKSTNPYGEWIIYGLPDPKTYYYRGAYMDLIRGIDFLASRPEVNPDNIFAEGGSQGGAFTLIACALDKRIKAAAPRIPFLSDFRDYFTICPWPRSVFEGYLKEHPDITWEKLYDVLSYFDVKNFAERITCPIIMGIGLQDETCPPHTNFASYNQIRSKKKYYVYPEQKHNVGENWWFIRETFFKENLLDSQRIIPESL